MLPVRSRQSAAGSRQLAVKSGESPGSSSSSATCRCMINCPVKLPLAAACIHLIAFVALHRQPQQQWSICPEGSQQQVAVAVGNAIHRPLAATPDARFESWLARLPLGLTLTFCAGPKAFVKVPQRSAVPFTSGSWPFLVRLSGSCPCPCLCIPVCGTRLLSNAWQINFNCLMHSAYLSLYRLPSDSENKLTINNFNYFMKMSNYTHPRNGAKA